MMLPQAQALWMTKETPGTEVLFLSSALPLEWDWFIHTQHSGLVSGAGLEATEPSHGSNEIKCTSWWFWTIFEL